MKLFGSARLITIGIERCYFYNYLTDILITKTHVKALDQPSRRCKSKTNTSTTTTCMASYIERQLGCTPNIQGSQYPEGVPCNTKAQIETLAKITRIFQYAGENEIFEETGCLSACEKDFFAISALPMEQVGRTQERCEVHAKFKIMDRSYEEKEQYIIYDTSSFFADVGGYMGLLLGCSLASLYNKIEGLLKKNLCSRSHTGRKVNIC